MEVWFQRATDVVRKLISGDIDIGIVGYDMLREIGNEDEDLVVVHDALGVRRLPPRGGGAAGVDQMSTPCATSSPTSAGPRSAPSGSSPRT